MSFDGVFRFQFTMTALVAGTSSVVPLFTFLCKAFQYNTFIQNTFITRMTFSFFSGFRKTNNYTDTNVL